MSEGLFSSVWLWFMAMPLIVPVELSNSPFLPMLDQELAAVVGPLLHDRVIVAGDPEVIFPVHVTAVDGGRDGLEIAEAV